MRAALKDFVLANRLYAGATVTFYTVSAGVKTSTKATLYAAPTGSATLANPQVLGSDGKLQRAVYIDAATIATVTGLTIASHDTGIIQPAPTFRVDSSTAKFQYSYDGGSTWSDTGDTIFKYRGAWVTATAYNRNDTTLQSGVLYLCVTAHTAGTFATDLAAGKWVALTKAREIVSILDFGAVMDDATDNRTAIQNAANSLTYGGMVWYPEGTGRTSGVITCADAVSIVGAGSAASVLKTTSASADVLAVGARALVEGIKFMSTVTRTGGSYIKCTGNNAIVRAVEMDGSYIGIWFYCAALYDRAGGEIDQAVMRSGSSQAGAAYVLIDNFSDLNIVDTTISGNTAVGANQSDYGIKITGADSVIIANINITQAGCALYMEPTAGNILSVQADNSFFDYNRKASGAGVQMVLQSGSNSIGRTRFGACWFGTNTADGCLINKTGGSGEIDGVDFFTPQFFNNGAFGMKAVGAKNVHVMGGTAAGNTLAGLYFGDCDTFSAMMVRCGPHSDYGANGSYGIQLAGTSDYGRIGWNDLRGNTLGAFTSSASGSTIKVRDNLGYVTEAGGDVTILSGSTSVVVTHGLGRTPQKSELAFTPGENPTTDPANMWIDTITSTQFTINCRTNPGASNLDVSWQANLR
jgi:hypothetical protein